MLQIKGGTPRGFPTAAQTREIAAALLAGQPVMVLGDFSEAGITGYSRINSLRNQLANKLWPVARAAGVQGKIHSTLTPDGIRYWTG